MRHPLVVHEGTCHDFLGEARRLPSFAAPSTATSRTKTARPLVDAELGFAPRWKRRRDRELFGAASDGYFVGPFRPAEPETARCGDPLGVRRTAVRAPEQRAKHRGPRAGQERKKRVFFVASTARGRPVTRPARAGPRTVRLPRPPRSSRRTWRGAPAARRFADRPTFTMRVSLDRAVEGTWLAPQMMMSAGSSPMRASSLRRSCRGRWARRDRPASRERGRFRRRLEGDAARCRQAGEAAPG